MPFLRGFLTLLVFLLIGESLRYLLAWPISGGLGGMLLLAGWLALAGRVSDNLASASHALISVLILLIMPGVVGIFFEGDKFTGHWLAIGVALILGTALSVATTLLLLKFTGESGSAGHE